MDNPLPFNQAVIDEFRANGGRVSRLSNGNPLLLLTTTGAKSGLPRTSPVGYSTEGDRLIIAATGMTGEGTHLQWYYNLLAHPTVTVERGTERLQARATVVTGRSASASSNSTPRSCRSSEHTSEEHHDYRP